MTEEPLQFGDRGRLFGILTLPAEPLPQPAEVPVFVFLSSGLLHRVGPRRLYVRLARELAQSGFTSLRVDLAGRGDSHPSSGITHEESVEEDRRAIVSVLESRLGPVRLILGGLCSAADDALRMTATETRVVGMLLLDPVCERDAGFRRREFVIKYSNPRRYALWVKRLFNDQRSRRTRKEQPMDVLDLRDAPTPAATRSALEAVREREGRVFTLFTSYATGYLNQAGQMGRVLGIEDYQRFCTELFWPAASHSFPLEMYRGRLIKEVKTWAAYFTPEVGAAER